MWYPTATLRVGLLTAFFGLSSGCLSLVYDVFFTSPTSFVYFLAFFAGGIDVCAAFLVGKGCYSIPSTSECQVGYTDHRTGCH